MCINCPKDEIVWVSYYNLDSELLYILTSTKARDKYTLYQVVDGELKKLGRAKTPSELEEKFELLKKND